LTFHNRRFFILYLAVIGNFCLLIQSWLENYALQISLSWWLFALPIRFIMLIALVTVGLQTLRAAVANPVHALKNE